MPYRYVLIYRGLPPDLAWKIRLGGRRGQCDRQAATPESLFAHPISPRVMPDRRRFAQRQRTYFLNLRELPLAGHRPSDHEHQRHGRRPEHHVEERRGEEQVVARLFEPVPNEAVILGGPVQAASVR